MITSKRKSDKNPRPQQDNYITQEKADQYQQNLDRLIKEVRPKLSKEVQRLAELGDFSENAAYQMAKGKLRGINNKILELKNRLDQAILIIQNPADGTIAIGSKVTVESEGQKFNYQILGSQETDPRLGKISHLSPFGSALIGHQKNDLIEIEINNKLVKYKIIDVK